VIDPYSIVILSGSAVASIDSAYNAKARGYVGAACLVGLLIVLLAGLLMRGMSRQRKLMKVQNSFNQLIEVVPQSISRVNAQGSIVWTNRRVVEFSRPSGQALAQGFDWVMAAVHPQDRDRLQDFVSRTLQQQATAQSCEYRKRRFDGAYLWYSAQVSKIVGAQGAEDFFLFCGTDIHDRKMAEERAGVAQKLESIGQLTGGMAHDFNNLLAIIIGNLDLVKLEPNAPLTSRKLDDAINAAQRGVGLVKSLLALASKQPLQPVQIDLGQLVERIAPLLRLALGPRIDFDVATPAKRIGVKVDEAGLESVLLNLIVNAKDAMPQGGSLGLHLQERDGMACLSVADNGTGMTDAVRQRATEPFFTTKEQGHGTGLGLSTCAGFAKQSGGSLKISSKPGEGTTIEIVLPISEPLAKDKVAQVTSAVAVHRKFSGTKRSVLVVEDEPAFADLVRSWAKSAGHRVLVLHSADDALALLAVKAFDVLLTDIMMPGTIDGIVLAEKASALCPGMKVVLMSGYSRETASSRADLPWPLLVKPFGRQDFDDALD
jgi:PAS domain S-box-containing protein